LKKFFAGIATIITILLILTSLACNAIPAAKSAAFDPETNPPTAGWKLTVTGLVENAFNLSWNEFIALPKTTVVATLICVDYPNNPMDQGNWTGVQLRTLLEEASPTTNAVKVGFFASDGYSTDLTVEAAMQENIILAYENNGVYTNDLRLVVPGRWGYKWISMLTHIEVLDYNYLGFWESRGYSDVAGITTGDVPQPLPDVNISPSNPNSPPATSPSPPASPTPSTSPQPTQLTPTPTPTTAPEISGENSMPQETGYIMAAAAVAVVLVALVTLVRKKRNSEK
jgi:hypothetical protein